MVYSIAQLGQFLRISQPVDDIVEFVRVFLEIEQFSAFPSRLPVC
jgi:hypothetical protein